MPFGPSYEVKPTVGATVHLGQPTPESLNSLYPVPQEVMTYLDGSRLCDALKLPDASTLFDELKRHTCAWSIEVDEKVVGITGLLLQQPRQVMPDGFTFVLDPAYWGKGVGTAARLGIVNHAFEQLHLPGVIGGAHENNTASNRLLQGLGFQPYTKFCTFIGYLLPAPLSICGEDPRRLSQRQADIGRRLYAERLTEYAIKPGAKLQSSGVV